MTTWTPRRHFDDDVRRAEGLLSLGEATGGAVGDDALRQAVAMAVGAMDAYLCDAYVDILVHTVRAVRDGSVPRLVGSFADESLPLGPLLGTAYSHRPDWALRMAARQRMEKDNMLQVSRIKEMFNPALPAGEKLWHDLIPEYAKLGRKRMTTWTWAEIDGESGDEREKRTKKAISTLLSRIGGIVQRRHDVVHNCDRPKVAVQTLTAGQARAMVKDVAEFVTVLDDHICAQRIA